MLDPGPLGAWAAGGLPPDQTAPAAPPAGFAANLSAEAAGHGDVFGALMDALSDAAGPPAPADLPAASLHLTGVGQPPGPELPPTWIKAHHRAPAGDVPAARSEGRADLPMTGPIESADETGQRDAEPRDDATVPALIPAIPADVPMPAAPCAGRPANQPTEAVASVLQIPRIAEPAAADADPVGSGTAPPTARTEPGACRTPTVGADEGRPVPRVADQQLETGGPAVGEAAGLPASRRSPMSASTSSDRAAAERPSIVPPAAPEPRVVPQPDVVGVVPGGASVPGASPARDGGPGAHADSPNHDRPYALPRAAGRTAGWSAAAVMSRFAVEAAEASAPEPAPATRPSAPAQVAMPVPLPSAPVASAGFASAAAMPDGSSGSVLPDQTADQIVRSIRLAWTRSTGEAHIRLDPRRFGDLSVSLRLDGDVVVARLLADTPAVREWLQANQHALKDALAGQDLRLDRLEVAGPERGHEPGPRDQERQRASDEEAPVRRPRRATGQVFEIVA